MLNRIIYGFSCTVPEFDLRLAQRPGFVQRFQSPFGKCGNVKSFWVYETKQAAEQARNYALTAEGIREVGELGSFETSRPIN